MKTSHHNRIMRALQYLPEDLDNLSILDCGIGHGAWAFYIRTNPRLKGRPFITGLDLYKPYLAKQSKLRLYNDLLECDVLEIPCQDNFFDIVIAGELIEHLTKEDGYKMMDEVERVSRGLVIITTPHGYMKQGIVEGNTHQEHLSGWHPSEFISRGYTVKKIDRRIMTRTILIADNIRRLIFKLGKPPKSIIATKVCWPPCTPLKDRVHA